MVDYSFEPTAEPLNRAPQGRGLGIGVAPFIRSSFRKLAELLRRIEAPLRYSVLRLLRFGRGGGVEARGRTVWMDSERPGEGSGKGSGTPNEGDCGGVRSHAPMQIFTHAHARTPARTRTHPHGHARVCADVHGDRAQSHSLTHGSCRMQGAVADIPHLQGALPD
jgi:hypothetical protein